MGSGSQRVDQRFLGADEFLVAQLETLDWCWSLAFTIGSSAATAAEFVAAISHAKLAKRNLRMDVIQQTGKN